VSLELPLKREKEAEGSTPASSPSRIQTTFVMERLVSLNEADRSFDFEYWRRLGDAAIFEAAWELAELYHRSQGMSPDELRLQRSVESLQRP
jgi:hypothetical protein